MTPMVPKHALAWRLLVTFAGGRQYLSPDVRGKNPGWHDECFGRVIERIEFNLPTGHRIVLAGMARYNFFVEATMVPGKNGNAARLAAIWLCGQARGSDTVEMWRVAEGVVKRARRPAGQEWGGGPTSGWKPGAPGRVISEVVRG